MATTPQEMIEMFQRMLNPMAFPMQSLLFPSLSAEEIEKKIAELKNVEAWLTANLSLLQMSIKMLEYQKSLLSGKAGEAPNPNPENPFANASLWPWNMMAGAGKPKDEK